MLFRRRQMRNLARSYPGAIIAHIAMAEPVHISLRYRGKSVDDGSMTVGDVVEALDGFAGAYGKIAARVSPTVEHQLRVTGVKKESFDILIVAAMAVGAYGDPLKNIATVVDAAKHVFSIITSVIEFKKHTKNQPYNLSVKGDKNTVLVINAEKLELTVPLSTVELIKEKLIDADLNKIVEPLEEGLVDALEVTADREGKPIGTTIESREREYFGTPPAHTTTRETEVTGTLVSLNKERNTGRFKLINNRRVPYRYVGHNRELFHAAFGVNKGPIRAQVIAELDENLEPIQLGILDVRPLQQSFSLSETSENSE
jgi:hypothetical protein